MKQSTAYNKREYNHLEQHQQKEEKRLQKTGQQKRVRLFFWHFHPAMLFSRVTGKLTKQQQQITNNVIFPKATLKTSFSGISQNYNKNKQ